MKTIQAIWQMPENEVSLNKTLAALRWIALLNYRPEVAKVVKQNLQYIDTKAMITDLSCADPEMTKGGLTESQAKAQAMEVEKGLLAWISSTRPKANRPKASRPMIQRHPDAQAPRGSEVSLEAHGHGTIPGAGMLGTLADDKIGETT